MQRFAKCSLQIQSTIWMSSCTHRYNSDGLFLYTTFHLRFRKYFLSSLLYRWGNWGAELLRDLSKIPQHVSIRYSIRRWNPGPNEKFPLTSVGQDFTIELSDFEPCSWTRSPLSAPYIFWRKSSVSISKFGIKRHKTSLQGSMWFLYCHYPASTSCFQKPRLSAHGSQGYNHRQNIIY